MADNEFKNEKYAQSLNYIEKALDLSPHSTPFKIFKGEILISLSKFTDAKNLLLKY